MLYSSFFATRRSVLRCIAFGSLVILNPALFLIFGQSASAQHGESRYVSGATAPNHAPDIPEAVAPSGASLDDTAADWMKRGADLEAAGKYEEASDAYDKAVAAYAAAGRNAEQAGALKKKALALEKFAEQLLGGNAPAKRRGPGAVPAPPAAAAEPKEVKLQPMAPRPGFFVGRCVTTQGKPLNNVFINIKGLTAAGQVSYTEVHSNASGIYQMRLPAGNYMILDESWPVTLGETGYNLPLEIVGNNDALDISAGIVRDMILRIHGRIGPDFPADKPYSYFGGSIRYAFYGGKYQATGLPAGTILETKLVPEGPLADGSAGKTLVLKSQSPPGESYHNFQDIPLGKYTITAHLVGADGHEIQTLLIGHNSSDNFVASAAGQTFPTPGFDSRNKGPKTGPGVSTLNLYVK